MVTRFPTQIQRAPRFLPGPFFLAEGGRRWRSADAAVPTTPNVRNGWKADIGRNAYLPLASTFRCYERLTDEAARALAATARASVR